MVLDRNLILIAAVAVTALMNCGPDAPRDNPLDPANRPSGVYGVVYRSVGGVVPGAVITARPANIATRSDQAGSYSIDLETGRYYLEVAYNGYRTVTDTVEIPQTGRLQHNFILRGLVTMDSSAVRTVVTQAWNGQKTYRVVPSCIGVHPDGAGFLSEYSFSCRIDSSSFSPDSALPRDNYSLRYLWSITQLPGISNFPQYVVGRTVSFLASSASYSLLLQRQVPSFLEPLPYSLYPANGQNFYTPDTLRWENGHLDVDIRIEISNSTKRIWWREIPIATKLCCDTTLDSGLYTWRVVTRDAYGNEGVTEDKFYQP